MRKEEGLALLEAVEAELAAEAAAPVPAGGSGGAAVHGTEGMTPPEGGVGAAGGPPPTRAPSVAGRVRRGPFGFGKRKRGACISGPWEAAGTGLLVKDDSMLSGRALQGKLIGCQIVKLDVLRKLRREKDLPFGPQEKWATLGVVTKTFERKIGPSGNMNMCVHIGDLTTACPVALVLSNWRIPPDLGAVVAVMGYGSNILWPLRSLSTPSADHDRPPALFIRASEQLVHVGSSPDVMRCRGVWKDQGVSKTCTNVVRRPKDPQDGALCKFHKRGSTGRARVRAP